MNPEEGRLHKELGKTMANETRFSRKISAEEAKKGYIFILKDQLSFFPPRGKSFTLHAGEQEKNVFVESYRCTCRGPQLPHEHYFIRWDGVKYGEKITIAKDEKLPDKFNLTSNR
jgi:hypothetical protein